MLNPTKLLLIALIWFCKSTSLPKLYFLEKLLATYTFSFGPAKKDSLMVRFWLNKTLLCYPCWPYALRIFYCALYVATLTML